MFVVSVDQLLAASSHSVQHKEFLMDPFDVYGQREAALQEIAEGAYQEGIRIRIVAEDSEADWFEGFCDVDGDGITVQRESQFIKPEDAEVVTIRFGRGVSQGRMVRVLRKCAEMFDGPHGCELANLAKEAGNSYSAYRLPNGKLYFYKTADDFMHYLNTILAMEQTEVGVTAASE